MLEFTYRNLKGEFKMQRYANHYGYSDVNPFEVIRVISEKTVEIRAMDSHKDPKWKPEWHVGGFAGHCANQHEQSWFITKNLGNPVIRIRLGKNGWKDKWGGRYQLADAPVKFYDYNF